VKGCWPPCAGPRPRRRCARVGLGACAGIKARFLNSATHGLAESLEHEAQVRSEPGGTADHRAPTFAFMNRERPVFRGG